MPSCSFPLTFLGVFEKYSLWGWETLPSLYRTSPFLILDFEDKTMYEMNKGEDPVKADGPVIINNGKEQMEDLHHFVSTGVTKRLSRVAWKDEKPYIF